MRAWSRSPLDGQLAHLRATTWTRQNRTKKSFNVLARHIHACFELDFFGSSSVSSMVSICLFCSERTRTCSSWAGARERKRMKERPHRLSLVAMKQMQLSPWRPSRTCPVEGAQPRSRSSAKDQTHLVKKPLGVPRKHDPCNEHDLVKTCTNMHNLEPQTCR